MISSIAIEYRDSRLDSKCNSQSRVAFSSLPRPPIAGSLCMLLCCRQHHEAVVNELLGPVGMQEAGGRQHEHFSIPEVVAFVIVQIASATTQPRWAQAVERMLRYVGMPRRQIGGQIKYARRNRLELQMEVKFSVCSKPNRN